MITGYHDWYLFEFSRCVFNYVGHFIGNQTVEGPNESFSAASKGFKRHQTMNKGLIKRKDHSFKKITKLKKKQESQTGVTNVQRAYKT